MKEVSYVRNRSAKRVAIKVLRASDRKSALRRGLLHHPELMHVRGFSPDTKVRNSEGPFDVDAQLRLKKADGSHPGYQTGQAAQDLTGGLRRQGHPAEGAGGAAQVGTAQSGP